MSETISPVAALVANHKPADVKAPAQKWTMKGIDALEGGRNNYVRVLVANPKKPGSIAHRNYALYGDGNITVAAFVKAYPKTDGGVSRARASLLWDLQRGFIAVETR